jgi:hypothetical protein
MNVGELQLIVIGALCVVGFIVVGVETRLHRRKLRRGNGSPPSQPTG